MKETTMAALSRLKYSWPGQLEYKDVYAMQLLHCYDICSGRTSPWMQPTELFTTKDWEGFEYLRDSKYFFSEGRGAPKSTGRYALPWLVSVLGYLKSFEHHHERIRHTREDIERQCTPSSNGRSPRAQFGLPMVNDDGKSTRFPLQICFTHREEILYLCSLLGLGCYTRKMTSPVGDSQSVEEWEPSGLPSDATNSRPWHVSTMACYLGHVGIEAYAVEDVSQRLRR